jgi:hypothetical protein
MRIARVAIAITLSVLATFAAGATAAADPPGMTHDSVQTTPRMTHD